MSKYFLEELSHMLKDKILKSSDNQKYWISQGTKYEQCLYRQVLSYMTKIVEAKFNDYIYGSTLTKQTINLLKNKLAIWKKGSVDKRLILDNITSNFIVSDEYLIKKGILKDENEVKDDHEIDSEDISEFEISDDSELEISDNEDDEEKENYKIMDSENDNRLLWMSNHIKTYNKYNGNSKSIDDSNYFKNYRFNLSFNKRINSIVIGKVSEDMYCYQNYTFDIFRFVSDNIAVTSNKNCILPFQKIYNLFINWLSRQNITDRYKCYKDEEHTCSHKCKIISKSIFNINLMIMLPNHSKYNVSQSYDFELNYCGVLFKRDIKDEEEKEDGNKEKNEIDSKDIANVPIFRLCEEVKNVNKNYFLDEIKNQIKSEVVNEIKKKFNIESTEREKILNCNKFSTPKLIIKNFIFEKITITDNIKNKVGATEIYNKFVEWLKSNNYDTITQTMFGAELKRNFESKKTNGIIYYIGINFKK